MSRLTAYRMPRWMVRVLVCMVVSQTAIFLVRPVLSYRAIDLGAGEREIGLLVALFALLPAIVALPVGRYSDRRRPTPVLQFSLIFLIIGSVILILAPSLLIVGLGTIFLGVGTTCTQIGLQALVARLSDEENLDRDFGLMGAGASLGQMLGPALGGLVLSGGVSRQQATTYAFVLGVVLALIALSLAWGFADAGRRPPRGSVETGRHSSMAILRFPGVMGGLFASLALLTAVDILLAYLPLLGERRGISPGIIGLLLSVRAAASVLSRLLIPAMLKRWGRPRLLPASTLGSGLLLALLPFTDQVWLMAVILVIAGFFLGIGQPLTMSLVVQAVPTTARGAALSIRVMGNKIGQVTLPAVVAVATGATGVGSAFVLLGAVLMAAAVGVRPRSP